MPWCLSISMNDNRKKDLINFVRTQKEKGRDKSMIADMIYFDFKTESYQKAFDIVGAVIDKITGVLEGNHQRRADEEPEEEIVYEREDVGSPINNGEPEPFLKDKPWLLQFKTFNVGSKKPNEEMIYAQPIAAQQTSKPTTNTTVVNKPQPTPQPVVVEQPKPQVTQKPIPTPIDPFDF